VLCLLRHVLVHRTLVTMLYLAVYHAGGLMALSSIFVVSNSLLLQLHGSFQNTEKRQGDLSSRLN
jgi:cation transport ATPase